MKFNKKTYYILCFFTIYWSIINISSINLRNIIENYCSNSKLIVIMYEQPTARYLSSHERNGKAGDQARIFFVNKNNRKRNT